MTVKRCNGRCFDLGNSEDWLAYTEFRLVDFGTTRGLPDIECTASCPHRFLELKLRSEGFVMVGSQGNPIGDVSRIPDQTPYREPRINWNSGEASVEETVVIPGSAIKGPLRHRTLFHFRKENPDREPGTAQAAIDTLFGTARDEITGTGSAGKIHVADASPSEGFDVEANTGVLPHVSIDRFSGGAYSSALFSTQALWRLPITVAVALEAGIDAEAQSAFDLAIGDLKTGHLQIGADGGDGLGVFLFDEAEVPNGSA